MFPVGFAENPSLLKILLVDQIHFAPPKTPSTNVMVSQVVRNGFCPPTVCALLKKHHMPLANGITVYQRVVALSRLGIHHD